MNKIKLFARALIATFIITIIIICSIIGYGLFIYSGDREKLTITDFSTPKEITLKPYKYKIYAMKNIKIKGYTNDTMLIYLHSVKGKPLMKLIGKVEEHWYSDYYGEGPVKLIFDPYKATEGELEIDFSL